jgi:hydrogenase maturation protein HypF
MHPSFITTKFAEELSIQFDVPLYQVQHHFAHTLGLMAENNIKSDEKIVGIGTDGVGFGEDGNIWGGEILISSYDGFKRLGSLEFQPMIGGDRCTKYPARMCASILLNTIGIEDSLEIFRKIKLEKDLEYQDSELKTILSQFRIANNKFPSENIPLSSSTGRIFDTVSYLLGATKVKTYRGEPAMRLEGLAANGNPSKIPLEIKYIKKDGIYIINTSNLILDIVNLSESKNFEKKDIAAKFQVEMGNIFAKVASKIAKENKIDKIGLTGGVAYNYSFSNAIKEKVVNEGFLFLEHNLIPPGDAGISLGQLIGGLFEYRKDNF